MWWRLRKVVCCKATCRKSWVLLDDVDLLYPSAEKKDADERTSKNLLTVELTGEEEKIVLGICAWTTRQISLFRRITME